ncbi:hypothetical protein [Clostridium sp.]|uniref:hypothetical protein n=1 Tax=Clostridium sp. TaxID=1506 RepID=UPI003D6D2A01
MNIQLAQDNTQKVERVSNCTGLTKVECEKLLIETNWDADNAIKTVNYFLSSLVGTVLAKESINKSIINCGLEDKLASSLSKYNTMRGGTKGFKGFVFEELHATDATINNTLTEVIANNGIDDFKIINTNGTIDYAQAKVGYKNTNVDWSKYEGKTIIIDKGNDKLINKAKADGMNVIESNISEKQSSILGRAMQNESNITGRSNASITPKIYATLEKGKQYHKAGVSGGITAGAFAAGISAGSNFFELLSGNKELSEISRELAVDTVKGVSGGYISTVTSAAAVSAIGSTTTGAAMINTISIISAPVVQIVSNSALGSAAIATGSSVSAVLGSTTVVLETTLAGSALSGTIAGNVILSIGSQLIAVSAIAAPVFIAGLAIGVAYGTFKLVSEYRKVNKLSKVKLEKVNSIAAQALVEMKYQRNLLKNIIEEEYEKWDEAFDNGFEAIFVSTINNDVEGISAGLNEILSIFGETVKFKTFEKFDEFFMDESSVFTL